MQGPTTQKARVVRQRRSVRQCNFKIGLGRASTAFVPDVANSSIMICFSRRAWLRLGSIDDVLEMATLPVWPEAVFYRIT